jgi:hypothetical protein
MNMVSIKGGGLDKLQRELEEAARAFQSLEGTIATLRFTSEAASVQAAIRENGGCYRCQIGALSK